MWEVERIRYLEQVLSGVTEAFNAVGLMDYDDWLNKYGDLLEEVEDIVGGNR